MSSFPGVARGFARRAFVALLGLCAACTAQAEVWEGTVGGQPVIADLHLGDEPGGQYFYRKHSRTIELMRTETPAAGVAFDFQEWGRRMDDAEPPHWRLSAPKGDALEGDWVGGGKTLPIRLHRLATASLPRGADPGLDALRTDDPYRFLLLSGMALKAGRAQTVNGFRLQWWTEPQSGVELFRVVSGYPAERLPAINTALARRQWEQVLAYLDCTAAPQSDFESTTTLRRIGRDVISVSLFASYFCGGAHPDFGDSPYNLDPRTGQELALEDVFWLGKGAAPRYDPKGASQAWFDYRGEVFGPWVAERMVALYPKQAKPSAPGDEADACDYGDPGVWSYANWYATPKGLHVSATFARVMRVCDDPDWSVIPWADVRRHPGKVKLAP